MQEGGGGAEVYFVEVCGWGLGLWVWGVRVGEMEGFGEVFEVGVEG